MYNFKSKMKNKNGDSSVFQIIICITIITFLLFFPIISFSYFKFQTSVDDIALTALRSATVRGGVDAAVMDAIVSEFEAKGYSFEGSTLNGDNAAKVIVWTNTNLCGNNYSFVTKEGHNYSIQVREWPADDPTSTSNPTAYYNSSLRRYRNGYSVYKNGGTLKTVNNGSEIKLRITVPISAHSKMINALYGLITPKNQMKQNVFLNEGYGYSVTLSALSELYQNSQVIHEK